jgi:hypothetical protein
MRALIILVRLLCLIPLGTGALDLLLGGRALSTVGTQLTAEALADPSLNSQLRFFGAIWLGFGVLLWHASSDLKAHATGFRLLCAALILSGIGRLISLLQLGVPAAPFVAAMGVELVVMPAVLWWHWYLLRQS